MSEQVTVQDMVADYLKRNGLDGLCGDDCGCGLDDLALCDSAFPRDCIGGHQVVCNPDACPEMSECELGPKAGERCMRPGKRPEKEADDD